MALERFLIAVWHTAGEPWRESAPLSVGTGRALLATAVGPNGTLAVLLATSHGEAVDDIAPGGSWTPLPRPPRGSVALAPVATPAVLGALRVRRLHGKRHRSRRLRADACRHGVGQSAVEPGGARLRLVGLTEPGLPWRAFLHLMEGRRELPAGQLELRPLHRHRRRRRRTPRARSGEPAPPLRTRTDTQAAPSFVVLLRRPCSALAHDHVAHRLLGGRLLLRAHDRAHPDCVLRAGSHRRRRSMAPAPPRISGHIPAPGPALSPPRALLVWIAGGRSLHRRSVDGSRRLQPRHGALARSGPLRRRRGEPNTSTSD